MKDIKIELNANEASGEAYWRKRCDTVEAELARLRDELHRADIALSESPFHGQEELAEASLADGIRNYRSAVEAELIRLRAENKALQADAALVRAVRRIPDMAKLWHAESRWYLHPGDAPCLPLGTGNSLEAALQAAGLMEGEK